MLCLCGCGGEISKEGNKYIVGHNNKGRTKENDESVRKRAVKITGRTKENHESVRRMVEKKTGRTKENNESVRRQADWMKNGGAMHITSFITKEGRRIGSEKTAEKLRGRIPWWIIRGVENPMKNSKIKIKSSKSHEGKKDSIETKLKKKRKSVESASIRSEKIKELWNDPNSVYHTEEYWRNYAKGKDAKPNKPETLILNILNKCHPNEWKYTGDYSFWINGKNPDFTCINGKKLFIEHFGTYWHEEDDPEERKKIFADFGYKTLVIWENELKNIKEVERKIQKFVEQEIK